MRYQTVGTLLHCLLIQRDASGILPVIDKGQPRHCRELEDGQPFSVMFPNRGLAHFIGELFGLSA
jgi:hypothetical protein